MAFNLWTDILLNTLKTSPLFEFCDTVADIEIEFKKK